MPIVPAICPSCGGTLRVDSGKEAAICEYCNNAYIVQDAINNYNTSVSIQAGVVNVVGQSDFEVVAGRLIGYHGSAVNVVIPDGVIEIGDSCFEKLLIETVVCPPSLRIIGTFAFSECNSLKWIQLNAGLQRIGDAAFCSCSSIEKVSIPNSVTEIGGSAFFGCNALTSVECSASIHEIGGRAFAYCKSLANFSPIPPMSAIDNSYYSSSSPRVDYESNDSKLEFFKYVFEATPIFEKYASPFIRQKEEEDRRIKLLAQKKVQRIKAYAVLTLIALHSMYIVCMLKSKDIGSWTFSFLSGIEALIISFGMACFHDDCQKRMEKTQISWNNQKYSIRSAYESDKDYKKDLNCLSILQSGISSALMLLEMIFVFRMKAGLSIIVFVLFNGLDIGLCLSEILDSLKRK